MSNQESKKKLIPSASGDFKMGMVVLIFAITCFHLFEVTYLPGITIVSNEILLGIVLFAVIYLWVHEVKDRKKLEVINVSLLEAQEELKRANIATMKTLIASEEARDPYLKGHSRRVTEYAMAIARKMDIGHVERKRLEYAGSLHDIGKIGISDAILHKPGKLNDKEWKVIREHPVMSAEILAPLKFLSKENIMIKHHHEKYDGSGYPDKLKGEQIPIGARILAVADAFDAMNSKRSYRRPLPKEKIIAELEGGRGTQLDPEVVDIFLNMLKKDDSIFEKE